MYCDQNHTSSPKLHSFEHKPFFTCNNNRQKTLFDNLINHGEAPKKLS